MSAVHLEFPPMCFDIDFTQEDVEMPRRFLRFRLISFALMNGQSAIEQLKKSGFFMLLKNMDLEQNDSDVLF